MAVRKIRNSWWVDFRWKNVRYRKRSPLNTRAGAAQYELILREKLLHGEPLDAAPISDDPAASRNMRFDEFAEHWFTTFVVPNNKPSEQQGKRQILDNHLIPWFGTQPLSSVAGPNVEQYKKAKLAGGLHPKTVNNHLAVLGKCLSSAVEWGHIDSRPFIRKLKVPPPPFDYLRPEEVERLLQDRTEPDWTDMVVIAVRTGLRLGELLALDWTNIDLHQRYITVRQSLWKNHIVTTKNHRLRYVPLTSDAFGVLAGRKKDCGFVFGRPDGKPGATETAGDVLRRKCRRIGLREIGWHVLRHTFASTLATRGAPLHTIQILLGHSSPTMTMRYAHLAPEAFTDAIRLLEHSADISNYPNFGQPAGNARIVRSTFDPCQRAVTA